MCKYFSIDGHWKYDKSEFKGYIVKEFDDDEETEELDNQIFYYGLSEAKIQQAIADNLNGVEDCLEFVITSYEETNLD